MRNCRATKNIYEGWTWKVTAGSSPQYNALQAAPATVNCLNIMSSLYIEAQYYKI